MTIYFITGNEHKFREFEAYLGSSLERKVIDLPELQEIDPKEIVRQKLITALDHLDGDVIVEDTSLSLDALNGLPGPLIKWFLQTIGKEGLSDIAHKYDNFGAQARAIIGYAKSKDEMYFFEGVVHGKIVTPYGDGGFEWDKIFMPDGHNRRFSEMTLEEKNAISHRRKAMQQLKDFLDKQ